VGRQTPGGRADLLGRRLLVLESPTPVLTSACTHPYIFTDPATPMTSL
jgi:hypothetical protein